MIPNSMSKHLGPWLAFVVTIAKAEYDERKPTEEKQSVEQRTASITTCDTKQRTIGCNCSKQDGKEHDSIDDKIAQEARIAKSSSKRKDSTLLYYTLHHQTTEREHH